MSIKDVVNVTVSRNTSAVTKAGFGIPLILGISKAFTERVLSFATLDAVAEKFSTLSKEYLAAQTIFAQPVAPKEIRIARRETSDVATVTVNTAVANTAYSLTLNGTVFEVSSGSTPTVGSIAALLVAAVNAGSEPVTAAATSGGSFTLTADVLAAPFSLKVDTRQSVAFTDVDTPAEDLAAISQEDDSWYGLMYTERDDADVLLIAAYIETKNKVFITASNASAIANTTKAADTTSLAAQLTALGYARTLTVWTKKADTEFPDAGILGFFSPLRPGSWTLNNQSIAGVTVDKLTDTQKTNLSAKEIGYYIEIGGKNVLQNVHMAEGEWPDVIVFADWVVSDIQAGVFGVLSQPGVKVPATDAGISLIQGQLRGTLERGLSYGGIDPDRDSVISVPKASSRSTADRVARVLNDVKCSFPLAGAIHATNINVELVA